MTLTARTRGKFLCRHFWGVLWRALFALSIAALLLSPLLLIRQMGAPHLNQVVFSVCAALPACAAAVAILRRCPGFADCKESLLRETADARVLSDVALHDADAECRELAARRLEDEAVLLQLALADEAADVRRCAAKRIKGQDALAQLLRDASDSSVRCTAAERVTDEAALTHAARNDASPYVRLYAVKRIRNVETLTKLLERESDPAVRCALASRLGDGAELEALARNAAERAVRDDAMDALSHEALLRGMTGAEADYARRCLLLYLSRIPRREGVPQCEAEAVRLAAARLGLSDSFCPDCGGSVTETHWTETYEGCLYSASDNTVYGTEEIEHTDYKCDRCGKWSQFDFSRLLKNLLPGEDAQNA